MRESGTTLQLLHEIRRRPSGRRRLAEATGRSEMAVRLELDRLRGRGLIELRREGPRITEAGRRGFEQLFRSVHDVQSIELSALQLDEVGVGAHILLAIEAPAWVLRDLAVRQGASGLVLLRREGGTWRFAHDGEPVGLRNPRDDGRIEKAFSGASSGDALILSFGPDRRSAGCGLWAVLAEILAQAA